MATSDTPATDALAAEDKARAEALLPDFKAESVLNQDQNGRRLTLLGTIHAQPGLLLVERAALPTTLSEISVLPSSLTDLTNQGANDVYAWYMANALPSAISRHSLKLNLIWPCGAQHIKKYSPQTVRMVTETPSVFAEYVRPYMVRKTQEGRLNWVYNIIEGRQEQQDIILRSTNNLGFDPEGFLLLPDMNWDRSTMKSLRLLVLVERRNLLSFRDLCKRDVPWLKRLWESVKGAVSARYGVEGDMLKAYVHYQPTYYHFHLHVVSVEMEPNATQAVGKAFSLEGIITMLECFDDRNKGFKDVDVTYAIGDKGELWEEVFGPLKEGRTPALKEGAAALEASKKVASE